MRLFVKGAQEAVQAIADNPRAVQGAAMSAAIQFRAATDGHAPDESRSADELDEEMSVR
ncbi:MAG: hypothetical protein ACRD44_08265 [Bryobacteraceae bacterium]